MSLGGYSLSPTNLSINDRLIGWMDDLAFYNRVMSENEMATTWQNAADNSNGSLVINFNFDEAPNHDTIKNYSIARAMLAILPFIEHLKGRIFRGQLFEANSQAIRSVKFATFVPGAPVLHPSNVPIVVSLEITITMTIRVRCLVQPLQRSLPLVPTSGTITYFDDDGKLYQKKNGRNRD